MWNATFRLLTASLLQAMGSTGCGMALYIMVVCCEWCISLAGFFVRRWFRCFLIVGIHASGISAPLSLLMLFGSSLMWIASFSFLVYQCLSRSISLVCFRWHVLKPRNSECVRVIYHCRVLSFFLAWIVLFPRCRLCRMCIVSCRIRHLACLDQRGLFSWAVLDGLVMRLARSCKRLKIPRLWVVRIIGELLVDVCGFSIYTCEFVSSLPSGFLVTRVSKKAILLSTPLPDEDLQ